MANAGPNLPGYQDFTELGKGSYGTVYKAKKSNGNVPCAVKAMQVGPGHVSEQTVENEYELMVRLAHKSKLWVPEPYDKISDPVNGMTYLCLELARTDLERFIYRDTMGNVSDHTATTIIFQIVAGVKFLHANNVAHRDLKPENILLIGQNQVKIADYGLSKLLPYTSGKTNNSLDVITSWYRPPELFLLDPKYSYEVDIWSVGCIAVELVTGAPLLAGAASNEEDDLLTELFRIFGTPIQGGWAAGARMPAFQAWFKRTNASISQPVTDHFHPRIQGDFLSFFEDICDLDPSQRPSAEDLLDHQLFSNVDPTALPHYQMLQRKLADLKQLAVGEMSKSHKDHVTLPGLFGAVKADLATLRIPGNDILCREADKLGDRIRNPQLVPP